MLFALLFVSPEKTTSGCHVRDHYDIKRMMVSVIFALIPVSIFGIYNVGYQHYLSMGQDPEFFACILKGSFMVIPLYVVVYMVGGFWEVVFAVVRRHEINEGFLVTGFLIPLIVPATIPLWQLALATSFGVVIGKEVFGGTGMNVFNPALVARAFLFFAYPASISGNSIWTVVGSGTVDTYTMATPLSVFGGSGTVLEQLSGAGYSFNDLFFGFIPGSVGETSTFLILLGALFLIVNGVGSWRIMISVFAGGLVMALIFNFFSPSDANIMALPAHYHFIMGGFAFGAVFMATDPVSSSATNTGKYIYGFSIGILTILVRILNPAYPEGMMLAILFMNGMAPLIDHVIVSRNVKRRLSRAAG